MGRLNLGGCIVSKNILEGKGNIKWCFREKPSNELDNGWRSRSRFGTCCCGTCDINRAFFSKSDSRRMRQ